MRRIAFSCLVCLFVGVAVASPTSARIEFLASFGEASPERVAFARDGGQTPGPVTAIRAGRLVDPEAGRILTNQVILIEGTRIRYVGPTVAIPTGAHTSICRD